MVDERDIRLAIEGDRVGLRTHCNAARHPLDLLSIYREPQQGIGAEGDDVRGSAIG